MKDILVTWIAILLLNVSAIAQNHYIGFKAGPGFTNINSSLFEDTEVRVGLNIGITYEYCISNNLSLSAEMLYAQRGFRDDFFARDDQNNDLGTITSDFNYDYISIPLKFSYSGISKTYGFISAGLIPAFIVDAKSTTPVYNGSGFDNETVDIKDNVTKFDISGMLEFGGGYRFTERFIGFISVAGQISFTQLSNDEYFNEQTMRHYGFLTAVGIKYKLVK